MSEIVNVGNDNSLSGTLLNHKLKLDSIQRCCFCLLLHRLHKSRQYWRMQVTQNLIAQIYLSFLLEAHY